MAVVIDINYGPGVEMPQVQHSKGKGKRAPAGQNCALLHPDKKGRKFSNILPSFRNAASLIDVMRDVSRCHAGRATASRIDVLCFSTADQYVEPVALVCALQLFHLNIRQV